MHHQPTQAGAEEAPRSSRGGKRRPAHLAALPDPREQERLGAEADRRARELLSERAGTLVDASGRLRSHITLSEYRQGRAPANKGRRFPVEVLAPEEVQAILDQLPKRGPSGARNRALIVLLWRSGLRIAEALALLPKDVDLLLGMVTVLEGKGAKRRVVGIDRMARRYLQAWLPERAKLGVGDDEPVFCTVSRDAGGPGRPVGASTVRETLKRYARKAGVKKRVHPHGLRHTHAFELSLEGLPVALIQAQLGHADLAMTEHYLRHLSPTQLLERIAQRACPDDPVTQEPTTAAALSAGAPVRTTAPPPTRARMDPPEPPPAKVKGQPAPRGQGAQRVLDALVANGGSATQAQLRRALGISGPSLLRQLHGLHDRGAILRTGFDHNRSVIWKVAPPPARLRPMVELRCPPNGEGPRRVLDAVDALGGRGSQAELARLLDLSPNTVHDHCLTLEAERQLVRGGLDKSTSRRGSQVWRLAPAASRYRLGLGGGYTMRLTAPPR
jgi:site-specific recombinase XerD/DNA-binding Lrp family transcriptional regulator